jgi:hypothetical protein
MVDNIGCLIDNLTDEEFAHLFSFQSHKYIDLNIQEGMTIVGFFEGEYGTWWEEDTEFSIVSYDKLIKVIQTGEYYEK